MRPPNEARALRPLPGFIFASRWLQLPLYLGLIVAQAIYVWLFWQELYHLVLAAFGNLSSLNHVLDAVTVVVGMRPAVAITLVELGLGLTGVRTALNVDKGLALIRRIIDSEDLDADRVG